MKNVFITTIQKHQEEEELIQEKAKKQGLLALGLVGVGTFAFFVGGFGLLKSPVQQMGWGTYAAGAILGALFGTLALLVIRTTYQDGKLQELKHRFQADVRAYAEGQYGIAVQHDIIHPDLQDRVGYGNKDGAAVAVKVSFPDEDSPLQISELAEKPAGTQ